MVEKSRKRLWFDRADYELLRVIDESVDSGGDELLRYGSELHPHGIRELAEPQTVRLVRTMMKLLDVFESGADGMASRLAALRSLYDELTSGLNVPLRRNTGRVILQILKELIRARGDEERRLRLAHDLRNALLGNPLFIRRLLRRYRLLEIPETWEPVTFDHHVHDANTKGRKSPTHLLMDAWIKGIRELQVIYYNYVPLGAADELLRAAAILDVKVRIGVEFRVSFRDRFVELIWTPRGFAGADDFLKFLQRPRTESFTRKCLKAARYRRKVVLDVLGDFNLRGRRRLNRDYGITLSPVSRADFLRSVRYGQPSVEHLGELLQQLTRRALYAELDAAKGFSEESKRRIYALLDTLTDELMVEKYLDVTIGDRMPEKKSELPQINRYKPEELCEELRKVSSAYRMTLNLSGLALEDVAEILYDCRGDITALEIFNLKDRDSGLLRYDAEVNQLRHALNRDDVVALKQLLRLAIARAGKARTPQRAGRLEKLTAILRDMPGFLSFYARSQLEVSLGSDSAGRPSQKGPGMGLVVVDTLGGRVRRQLRRGHLPELKLLPVTAEVYRDVRYLPRKPVGPGGRLLAFFGPRFRRRSAYVCTDPASVIGGADDRGNLATLGRFHLPGALLEPRGFDSLLEGWDYLNSNLKIALKILIGFAAAFLSFYFTASWWFLVWFGAAIWLGITAVRNVIQAAAAAGGIRNSQLSRWNDFVSWQRVADSLLYTGLSVPLLDYVVKGLLLQRLLGWTAEDHPILVFTGIAVANGFYISTHNFLRAFPRSAILGNWLRAPLSIPLAFFFNSMLGQALLVFRVPGVEHLLQQLAAILSKLASDLVGGVIEARADRDKNIAARLADFRVKFAGLFALMTRVELLLPEKDLPKLLREKRSPAHLSEVRRTELATLFTINALDFLYIWARQPQAPAALREIVKTMTAEERQIFVKSQEVLTREKGIRKLFLNRLLGRHYRRALNFYLHTYRGYLKAIAPFARAAGHPNHWRGIVEIFSPREQ